MVHGKRCWPEIRNGNQKECPQWGEALQLSFRTEDPLVSSPEMLQG